MYLVCFFVNLSANKLLTNDYLRYTIIENMFKLHSESDLRVGEKYENNKKNIQ